MEITKQKSLVKVDLRNGKEYMTIDLSNHKYVVDVEMSFPTSPDDLLNGHKARLDSYCDMLKAAWEVINSTDE